jgi:hypothetical protein
MFEFSLLLKESSCSYGQQFHQYQQKNSPLNSDGQQFHQYQQKIGGGQQFHQYQQNNRLYTVMVNNFTNINKTITSKQ